MSGFGQLPFTSSPYGLGAGITRIANWSPLLGSEIERLGVIRFDVINDSWALTSVEVRAITPVTVETVWDGAFGEIFRRGSAMVPITNGWRFFLRRTTGWQSPFVNISVKATDLAGDIVSVQSP